MGLKQFEQMNQFQQKQSKKGKSAPDALKISIKKATGHMSAKQLQIIKTFCVHFNMLLKYQRDPKLLQNLDILTKLVLPNDKLC